MNFRSGIEDPKLDLLGQLTTIKFTLTSRLPNEGRSFRFAFSFGSITPINYGLCHISQKRENSYGPTTTADPFDAGARNEIVHADGIGARFVPNGSPLLAGR